MDILDSEHYHPIPQSNYLDKKMFLIFDSWEEFKAEFSLHFFDHNLIYRFDFKVYHKLSKVDDVYFNQDENGEIEELELEDWIWIEERGFKEGINLQLSIIQQRKGNFLPVFISNIQKNELDDIEAYIKVHFNHILQIWKPFKA